MGGRCFIGALDQGTRGTRFVVFDDDGNPVSDAYTGHLRANSSTDCIEYEPLRLWSCATDAIRRGLVEATVEPDDLRALGVSSQRQTLLAWEAESGTPVTNAVSWQDRRANELVAALDDGERRLVRERTGLVPDGYFAAPKAQWLLDNGGDDGEKLRNRAETGDVLLGTIDSWLVYNLTGVHATDVTNAAQTMLFDVHELAWDDDLLATFDVPKAALPTVHASSDPDGFGTTDTNGILNAAVPITGVMGDQQAALLGRGAFDEGDAKVTYGTGNFYLQNTGHEPVESESLLTTVWFQRAGERPWYGLEGPVFTTGALLEWLQGLGLMEAGNSLDGLGVDAEDSGPVTLVPGFGGLGAPDWVSNVETAAFGLTRDTSSADLLRAAVEAIAYGTRAVVEAAEDAADIEQSRLLVDGGAVQDDEFVQLQADLLGRELVRSDVKQTTALGAAIAAGLAADVWDSLDDLEGCRPTGRTFEPSGDDDAYTEAYEDWRETVEILASLR